MVDLIVNCPELTPKGHISNEWQWAVFLYMEGGMGPRGKKVVVVNLVIIQASVAASKHPHQFPMRSHSRLAVAWTRKTLD